MSVSDAVTVSQLTEFARAQLRPILHKSGEVLYSGAATLRPGEVYLLGLIPEVVRNVRASQR